MKNNTVVTIGDKNYLWGLFLLIASMRKAGMDEPVLVGTRSFTPEAERVLTQLGDVRLFPLDGVLHSLTCLKARVMLEAETDYVTWADSDAFFTGNCSKRLPPLATDEIHARMRRPEENPFAFRGYTGPGEDGRTIPAAILDAWRRDILGPDATVPSRIPRSCSACCLSFHRSARPFLEKWDHQMMTVLPQGDVGVVDRSLKFYHQLDESCLNSCLAFFPGAPRVSDDYRLNKDPNELFVHFVGPLKPWKAWTPASIRHFDRYVSVVEWAASSGLILPSDVPYSLVRDHFTACRVLARPNEWAFKIQRRIRRLLKA